MCEIMKREDFNNQYEWAAWLGNYGEDKFLERCSRKNINCHKASKSLRYDFVIEINGKFKKVQVKSISLEQGRTIHRAPLSTHHTKSGNRMKYTKDEIDFFALYLYENDEVYLVPVDVLLDLDKNRVHVYDSEFLVSRNPSKATIDIKRYKNW